MPHRDIKMWEKKHGCKETILVHRVTCYILSLKIIFWDFKKCFIGIAQECQHCSVFNESSVYNDAKIFRLKGLLFLSQWQISFLLASEVVQRKYDELTYQLFLVKIIWGILVFFIWIADLHCPCAASLHTQCLMALILHRSRWDESDHYKVETWLQWIWINKLWSSSCLMSHKSHLHISVRNTSAKHSHGMDFPCCTFCLH